MRSRPMRFQRLRLKAESYIACIPFTIVIGVYKKTGIIYRRIEISEFGSAPYDRRYSDRFVIAAEQFDIGMRHDTGRIRFQTRDIKHKIGILVKRLDTELLFERFIPHPINTSNRSGINCYPIF